MAATATFLTRWRPASAAIREVNTTGGSARAVAASSKRQRGSLSCSTIFGAFLTRALKRVCLLRRLRRFWGTRTRSVMKYVHVRQEAQDRAMEQFECQREAQNISALGRSSGFGPVNIVEKRENAGSGGMLRGTLSYRKIN
jgi:hypothetical protein